MFKKLIATALLTTIVTPSFASLILQGTRVVYPSNSKTVSILAENRGKNPVLAQSWIDDGVEIQNLSNDSGIPFILTPPITKINPGKSQEIRLIYNKSPLPEDRESLYWLNVLDIPSQSKNQSNKNSLELTIRTRIKIFFRPSKIKENPLKAPSQVEWTISKINDVDHLKINNPTPFYITFTKISLNGIEDDVPPEMVAPFSETTIPLKKSHDFSQANSLKYTFINDLGASIIEDAKLTKTSK